MKRFLSYKPVLFLVLIAAMCVLAVGCATTKQIASVQVTEGTLSALYTVGDELDLSQATLTVNYTDGTTKTVALTPAMLTNAFNSRTAGSKTLTIVYDNYPLTFRYTVSLPQVQSHITHVEVQGLRTQYRFNESFDATGGQLIVTVDSQEEPLIYPVTTTMVSGFRTDASGDRSCTVEYETPYGKATATFAYTVAPRATVDKVIPPDMEAVYLYQYDGMTQLVQAMASYPFTFVYSDGTTQSVYLTATSTPVGELITEIPNDAPQSLSIRIADATGHTQTVTVNYIVKPLYDSQTVTFDPNINGRRTFEQTTVDGKATQPIVDIPGYRLLGWYEVIDGVAQSQPFDFDALVLQPITLQAQWERIDYTVTIIHFGLPDDTLRYNIDSSVTLPTPRSREGYTFAGYVLADGTPIERIVAGTTGNFNVYGRWNAIAYDITYRFNDTATYPVIANDNPAQYTIDTDLPLVAPVRNGFTFAGWTIGNQSVETLSGRTGAVVLDAHWTATQYTLSLVQDSTGALLGTLPFRITDSDTVVPDATLDDYRFFGWYTDADCTKEFYKVDGRYILRSGTWGDFCLYAHTKPAYTVTLNRLDGTAADTLQFVLDDGMVDLPIPQRDACDFAYWYVGADASVTFVPQDGHIYVEAQQLQAYHGSILYAQWIGHTHTVYYHLGYTGADGDCRTDTFDTLRDYTVAPLDRNGYTFVGWFGNEQFAGDPVTTIPALSYDADRHLYARWRAVTYTITVHYDLPEELISYPITVPTTYTADDATIAIDLPQADYHVFNGWYADSERTTRRGDILQGSWGDVELYASWTPISYTMRLLNADGTPFDGDYAADKQYDYSMSVVRLAVPVKAGYNNGSWYADEQLSTPVTQFDPKLFCGDGNEFTAYARMGTALTYAVTYNLNGGINNTDVNRTQYTADESIQFAPATRNGYDFLGWYTDKELTQPILTTVGRYERLTLYAAWSDKVTYHIDYIGTLDADLTGLPTEYQVGGDLATTAKFAAAITTPLGSARYGYKLDGLYLDDQYTVKVTLLGGTSPACQDVQLHAKWTPITYSVVYKTKKGATASSTTWSAPTQYKTFTLPTLADFALPDPTIDSTAYIGYDFFGWYTNADNTGSCVTRLQADTLPTLLGSSTTLTLYATLTLHNYNVNYHVPAYAVNPETNPATITYSTTAKTLTAPTVDTSVADQYLFVGWYDNAQYQGTAIKSLVKVDHDIDLYAYYEPYRTIRYADDSGDLATFATDSLTARFTSHVDTTLKAPSISGLKFFGWYYVEGNQMVGTTLPAGIQADVTLRAMFYNGSVSSGSLQFRYDADNGYAVVTGAGVTTITSVTLPTYLGTPNNPIPVTAIAAEAFANYTKLATLNWAPQNATCTITTVGNYAFAGTAIKTLSLPSSIAALGSYTFQNVATITALTANGNFTCTKPFQGATIAKATVATQQGGLLEGVRSLTSLTIDGTHNAAYYFGTASSIPADLTSLYVTGNSLAVNLIYGMTNLTDLYLQQFGALVTDDDPATEQDEQWQSVKAIIDNVAGNRTTALTVHISDALSLYHSQETPTMLDQYIAQYYSFLQLAQ